MQLSLDNTVIKKERSWALFSGNNENNILAVRKRLLIWIIQKHNLSQGIITEIKEKKAFSISFKRIN